MPNIVYVTELGFEHDEVDSPETAAQQALQWIRDPANIPLTVEVTWKDPERPGYICSVTVNEEDLDD